MTLRQIQLRRNGDCVAKKWGRRMGTFSIEYEGIKKAFNAQPDRLRIKERERDGGREKESERERSEG